MSQQSFRLPTFELAREALKSRVHYEPNLSVYDIESLGVRDFDVVIFAGVYYHLKDPLRALATLRRVMKEGGANHRRGGGHRRRASAARNGGALEAAAPRPAARRQGG
jgi:hypothetical protein